MCARSQRLATHPTSIGLQELPETRYNVGQSKMKYHLLVIAALCTLSLAAPGSLFSSLRNKANWKPANWFRKRPPKYMDETGPPPPYSSVPPPPPYSPEPPCPPKSPKMEIATATWHGCCSGAMPGRCVVAKYQGLHDGLYYLHNGVYTKEQYDIASKTEFFPPSTTSYLDKECDYDSFCESEGGSCSLKAGKDWAKCGSG
ncbi:hypothetical protein JDV02_008336 [Purpureocillium takamizusanense]|uniref:Uncharacterized protein n=1 Tax=Purpureocillium takamizusanense TaxID=2060973 RepID=A0A9Q8QQ26_9HYPO|nr:uncharacterized protein JDV02_008336 [Purpureocillium takamizusanense]UNI22447.1 hypothetical protein JDV02_008336 [Purpureocillium takamizusanense]